MTLSIADVITLGKMGFTKSDIAALMGAQPGTPQTAVTPAPAPQAPAVAPAQVQTAPAVAPATAQAPATPDYAAMMASIADLSAKVSALSVPSAGPVGNPPQVTSVEDIILAAYQPMADNSNNPDFSKGVIK